MTALGSIRFQNNQAAQLRNSVLERAVASVSQEEADNGASQSDGVRLASRREDKDSHQVPFSVYLSRAAQFRSSLKKTNPETETKEPECPIQKARAESLTGENAPLNWLVADQYGGAAEFAPAQEEFSASTNGFSSERTDSVFTAQPQIADSGDSLLEQEWLLSPCA